MVQSRGATEQDLALRPRSLRLFLYDYSYVHKDRKSLGDKDLPTALDSRKKACLVQCEPLGHIVMNASDLMR